MQGVASTAIPPPAKQLNGSVLNPRPLLYVHARSPANTKESYDMIKKNDRIAFRLDP